MKFYTAYDRPEPYFEEHPDEGVVERAGYMETEQMVAQLLIAGQNLQVFREAEYAYDEEVPEDAPANKALSELDAVLAAREVGEKIKKQRMAEIFRKVEEEAKAKEEKKVEEPSQNGS